MITSKKESGPIEYKRNSIHIKNHRKNTRQENQNTKKADHLRRPVPALVFSPKPT